MRTYTGLDPDLLRVEGSLNLPITTRVGLPPLSHYTLTLVFGGVPLRFAPIRQLRQVVKGQKANQLQPLSSFCA